MKRVILVITVALMLLTGCLAQGQLRPNNNDKEVWICENPYMELYWKEDNTYGGKLITGEKEYYIVHSEDSGLGMDIYEYTKGFYEFTGGEEEDYILFRGKVNYGGDRMTLTVEEDIKNVFDGELPVMELVKYDIEEYFKDKE